MQYSVSAALAAVVLFLLALAGFGALFPVFSQLAHPVAMLGASGVPRAAAFNACAFVLPGLLLAWVAVRLRGRLSAQPFVARLGSWALAIAAMAFAAQGLLPLDSQDLHSLASARHGAAWTFWWTAFAAGEVLLAAGTARGSLRATGRLVLALAAATLLLALFSPLLLPAGLAQRLAFATWFAAMLGAARGLSRSGA